jgi:hypothetical protein
MFIENRYNIDLQIDIKNFQKAHVFHIDMKNDSQKANVLHIDIKNDSQKTHVFQNDLKKYDHLIIRRYDHAFFL